MTNVFVVDLFFCMELVPNLGSEFVLWRTETAPLYVGGTGRGTVGLGGGESSARRARICCSGTLLRLPYLELMLLRTLLEALAESESES